MQRRRARIDMTTRAFRAVQRQLLRLSVPPRRRRPLRVPPGAGPHRKRAVRVRRIRGRAARDQLSRFRTNQSNQTKILLVMIFDFHQTIM